MSNVMQVKFLGSFSIKVNDCILDESTLCSKMLTKLLVYILANHDRCVTNTELIQYLWSDSQIDSPKAALKNLMCRLRNILNKSFGIRDCINSSRGSYRWSEKYQLDIDTENFEAAYTELRRDLSNSRYDIKSGEEQRLAKLRAAADMYNSKFLIQSDVFKSDLIKSDMNDDKVYFFITHINLYHSMYMHLVEELYQIYWERKDYISVEDVCNRALLIDERDEHINIVKIRALIKQGKKEIAYQYYNMLEKRLKGSNDIHDEMLLKSIKNELEHGELPNIITVQSIQKDIDSAQDMKGAFQCTFEEFKSICVLQKLKNRRSRAESYFVLITVDSAHIQAAEDENVLQFSIRYAIEGLLGLLKRFLRECDVVSRCSDRQYVVLLNECSYSNALIIAARIKKQYYQYIGNRFAEIKIDVSRISSENEE